LTGPLFKAREANGGGKDDDTGRKRLYGNMTVLNLKHWQGLSIDCLDVIWRLLNIVVILTILNFNQCC
jgi:hypothetical protein